MKAGLRKNPKKSKGSSWYAKPPELWKRSKSW